MRFGINALLLGRQAGYRRSGISRYLDQLLAALPMVLGEDDCIVYCDRGLATQTAPRLHWKPAWFPVDKPPVRIAWEQVALPIAARRDHLAVFHGPVNVLPKFLPCPSVVTIHDLAFLRWPDQVPARRYRYLATAVRDAVTRAAVVIAVSESTKADIADLLGVEPARIVVTHLGVDRRFRPPPQPQRNDVLARAGIDTPYLLAVGNLEPRKNLPALLRAFANVSAHIPHDLVLVGAEGWLTGEIHATIASLRLGDRVKMTGFVRDDDLPAWYSGADLFVFPSLYEGFGLPVIEAMACGTPVLTSNTSSLPEVAGDAALTVDPTDVDALASGITRLLADRSLADDLRQRGQQRAATFTWERTAAQTVAVYRKVAR